MSKAGRLRPRLAWVAFALPIAAAAVVFALRWSDSTPESVDVAARAPRYSTVEELVAASDLIVLGRIESVAGSAKNPVEGYRAISQILKERKL